MKMYIRLLFLSFWCWRHGITMGIDDSVDGYYIIGFRDRNSRLRVRTPRMSYVISVKPCREPYIICNKIRRAVYSKMVLKRGKSRMHIVNFIEPGLMTIC